MRKIIFLLCLKLFTASAAYAQCNNCAEIIPLVNGNFSDFNGPLALYTDACLSPTPLYSPFVSGGYFSNVNLPNWKRIFGKPSASPGILQLETIDHASAGSGHYCLSVGAQGAAANYPFLKNGKYEVTLNFYNWFNKCLTPGNATMGIFATSGWNEPATLPYYLESGTFTLSPGIVIGGWAPPVAGDPLAGVATSISFCTDVLEQSFDQLLITADQNHIEFAPPLSTSSPAEPRGFFAQMSSVKVRICNECPSGNYFISGTSSPDPVTAIPFWTGGLFIDAIIKIDGQPFTNNPAENTMLIARAITANQPVTMGHAFSAVAQPGHFFEIVPSAACPITCDLPPIVGPDTLCPNGEATYTDASYGGTWSGSDPALLNVNPTTGGVHAVTGAVGAFTITYTAGPCSVYKIIAVLPASDSCKTLRRPAGAVAVGEYLSEANNQLRIYPNPVQENLTISYPCNSTGQLEISIKDVSGRVRYTQSVLCTEKGNVEHTVDVSSFSPGIYFAELTLNGEHVVKKIVKL